MTLQTIDGHTFDADLLPAEPTGAFRAANILDAGCAGFIWTKHFFDLGHNVLPIDIQDLGSGSEGNYLKMGLYFHSGKAKITEDEDPQARRITDVQLFKKGEPIPPLQVGEIYLGTIEGCAKEMKIEYFDIVKLDIEGAEQQIIMHLSEPPATQLSIEFHLHTGAYRMVDVEIMVNKLHSIGYSTVSHELSDRHGCGMNFWDSLFVLR